MSFTNREATEALVAGCQPQMYRIDVERGTILETLTSTSAFYTHMRQAGQYICASTRDGSIHLLDSRTLVVTHSWKAYAGQVMDMDARGDYLLTCGWAQMQYQGLSLERLVRVYDLKTHRPAPPVPFPAGAAFVRMHPKLSSTCIILSEGGLIHSVDIQNPDIPSMRYVQSFADKFTGLELMPSGKGFVLADHKEQVVLWGSPSKIQFTEYSKPTEFADLSGGHKSLDWSDHNPLNVIGMPYYREALLSSWPNSLLHQVGMPSPRIEVDASFRAFEYGKVGPHSRSGRRYEAPDLKVQQKPADILVAPKFLSEKPRDDDANGGDTGRRMSEDLLNAMSRMKLEGKTAADVRFLYRVVEIKYSKFGVDDFDFRYFNKTSFAGLETHIVNSYANPLLQILRFTNGARNLALRHTARDCRSEDCLFCELGFLIDMLEKAKGLNCQATNFLKCLGRQGDAATQNVLETSLSNGTLATMIQNLTRYLFQKLEENVKFAMPTLLTKFHFAFGTTGLDFTRCAHCSYESRSDKIWFTHDLVYPPRNVKHRGTNNMRTFFSQILKASIEKQNQHRGWCLRCNGYKAMTSNRAIHALPAVFMLNAAVHTPDAKQLWDTPGFLPREIGVIVNNGRFFCYEGQDLQLHLQRGQYNITVYQLVGVVSDVKTEDSEKSHLVASIDVGLANPDPTQSSNWHLFNDFLVHKLPTEEALHFNSQWKLPSVIVYQVKLMSHKIDDNWKHEMDTSILYQSPMQPVLTPGYCFRALSDSESLPGEHSHVAIDAEFVRLLREEIDVGADGTRTMTRPARLGLARVSVLRGDGIDQELTFIDDYIAIDEPIDDYLTQYSGLRNGDLNPETTQFQLVSLKKVYKKLWLLLNLGCKFIGHGLSSDFRTINIHVPESQVIDTQDLFSLKARTRRKLSLRFLAWVILKTDIQHNTEIGHDSIEDARTALRLWRKYIEFENAGVLEQMMDEIYSVGRSRDFRPPTDNSGGRSKQPETPTASAPGTPSRAVVRMATPGRSEFGSPQRRII